MTRYIASLSGGKDSTAMVLLLLENKEPLNEVVFIDTGMEFPEMYEHIARLSKVIESHGVKFTTIKASHSFEYYLLEKPIKSKKYGDHYGYGFPLARVRWCTNRLKIEPFQKYIKGQDDVIRYIGFAYDEPKRWHKETDYPVIFPLVNLGMTEKECLDYCYSKGYDWGGLYETFNRVSCWCCPMQKLSELKKLHDNYPDLWAKLQEWEGILGDRKNKFTKSYSIKELTEKFDREA